MKRAAFDTLVETRARDLCLADKSLWPWTAVPAMPPDAWACVLAHLDHQSVLNFSAVCKAYREQALRSRHWKHRLDAVLAKAPGLAASFKVDQQQQPGNEWKWFARLAGMTKSRWVNEAEELALIKVCISLSIPWVLGPHDCTGWTLADIRNGYALFSGEILSHYMRLSHDIHAFIVGKPKAGRNIRVQWRRSGKYASGNYSKDTLRAFLHSWLRGQSCSLFSHWPFYRDCVAEMKTIRV